MNQDFGNSIQPVDPNQGQWLSMSEASALTPYSAEYLSLLARKKKLTAKKIGKVWYTTAAILNEYMKRQMIRNQIQNGDFSPLASKPVAATPVVETAQPVAPAVVADDMILYSKRPINAPAAEIVAPVVAPIAAPLAAPAAAPVVDSVEFATPAGDTDVASADHPSTKKGRTFHDDLKAYLDALKNPNTAQAKPMTVKDILGASKPMKSFEKVVSSAVAPTPIVASTEPAKPLVTKAREVNAPTEFRFGAFNKSVAPAPAPVKLESVTTRGIKVEAVPSIGDAARFAASADQGVPANFSAIAQTLDEISKKLNTIADADINKIRVLPGQPNIVTRSFRTVFGHKPLVYTAIGLVVFFSIFPTPFVFGFFDGALAKAKQVWNDSNTVMGFRPGTHENEVLLLDKQGNISIMGHIQTDGQFQSFAKDGIAPIVVDSRTEVKNLNAEMVGGNKASDFTLAFVTKNGNVTTDDVYLEGSVEVGNTLLVKGASKLLSSLEVDGNLAVFGDAKFNKSLTVTGPAFFEAILNAANIRSTGIASLGEVITTGSVAVGKNISVRGSVDVAGTVVARSGSFRSLGVSGDFSAHGEIALGNPSDTLTINSSNATLDEAGNLAVDGNLTVGGSINGSNVSLTGTTTVANLAVSGAAVIQSLTAQDASITNGTTTNATSTNFFASVANIVSLAVNSMSVGALTGTDATLTNAVITNSTTTNATSTNSYADNLNATNAVITYSTTTSAFVTNLVSATAAITDASLTNASISNSTTTYSTTTNAYIQQLISAGATFTNASASNATITNATTTSFFSSVAQFALGIIDTLTANSFTATNATATNSTSTNAYINNATVAALNISSSLALASIVNCNLSTSALQTDAGGNVVCGMVSGGSGSAQGGGWLATAGYVQLSTTTDQVGIGTTTPTAKLAISSISTGTTTLALAAAVGQTANILNIYDNTRALSDVITPTGFLGLGTTSPSQRLSVQGNALFSGDVRVAGLNFVSATGTAATTTSFFASVGRFTNGVIDTFTSTLANITTLVANSISVGALTATNSTTTNATTTAIATTNITATGTASFQNLTFVNATGTNATTSNLFSTTASSTNLFSANATLGATNISSLTVSGSASFASILGGSTTVTNLVVTNTSTSTFAGPITAAGGNFTVMQGSGFVGVGTSSPQNSLHVSYPVTTGTNGDVLNSYSLARFMANTTLNGLDRGLQIGAPAGGIVAPVFLKVLGTSNRFAIVDNNNKENLTILEGGNVGLGTTSPYASLSVAGATGVLANVFTATSSNATSTFAGALAIGTTSPSTAALTIDLNNRTGEGAIVIRGSTTTRSYIFLQRNDGVNNASGLLIGQQTSGNGLPALANASVIRSAGGLDENLELQPGTNASTLARGRIDLAPSGGIVRIGANAATSALLNVGTTSPSVDLLRIDGSANNSLVFNAVGAFGIGTTSPFARLAVQGTSTNATNAFLVANSANTTLFNVQNNGNVGIGTTSPFARLSVTGDAYIGGNLTATGTATTTNLAISSIISSLLKTNALGQVTAAVAGDFWATSSADYYASQFGDWSINSFGALAPTTTRGIFVVASSTIGSGAQTGGLTISGGATTTGNAYFVGNVGIGTTSPTSKLSVVGASYLGGNVLVQPTGNGPQLVVNANGSGNDTELMLGNGLGAWWDISRENGANANTGDLTFESSVAGAVLSLENNGNIGIGTTSTQNKLDVVGSIGLTGTNGSSGLTFDLGSNNPLSIYKLSTNIMTVNSRWYVNNQGTLGAPALGYNSGGAGNGIYFPNNGLDFGIQTNSLERIRVAQGGNVGVGTTSPSALFAVQGNVMADSFVGTSTVLTANPSISTTPLQINLPSANGGLRLSRTETATGNVNFIVTANGGGQISSDSDFNIAPGNVVGTFSAIAGGAVTNTLVLRSGNVGVGTSTPSAKLAVSSFGGTQLQFVVASSTGSGATTTHFIVDRFGNVGVGTSTPQVALDVSGVGPTSLGSGNMPVTIRGTAGDSSYAGFAIFNPSNPNQYFSWAMGGSTTADVRFGLPTANGAFIFANNGSGLGGPTPSKLAIGLTTDAPIYFANNNVVRLTIASTTGNVGIGTSTPTARLSVLGSAGGYIADFAGASAASPAIRFLDSSTFLSVIGINQSNNAYNDIDFRSGNASQLRLSTNGNVGIGSTSPFTKLSLGGDAYLGGNVTATGTLSVDAGGGATSNATVTLVGRNAGVGSTATIFANQQGGLLLWPAATRPFVISNTGATAQNAGSLLQVSGSASFGSTFNAFAAPTNGVLIEGSVGIGTTSPQQKLDVLGNIRLSGSGNNAIEFYDGTNGALGPQVLAQITANNTVNHGSGVLQFFTAINNSLNEAMRIDRSGNVGIGTTSPSSALHIWGNGDSQVTVTSDADNVGEDDNPLVLLQQDGNLVNGLFGISGTANVLYSGALANATYIESKDTGLQGGIQFVTGGATIGGTDGTARMTILHNGNIGIGTSTPLRKLDIYSASSGNDYDLQVSNLFYNKGIKLGVDSANVASIQAFRPTTGATTDSLAINPNGGNVGIGTSTPVTTLTVDGSSSGRGAVYVNTSSGNVSGIAFGRSDTTWRIANETEFRIYSGGPYTPGAATFMPFAISHTAPTNSFYINSVGNVGLGTTSPFAKLSVAGGAYIGGNLTATGTTDLQALTFTLGTGTSATTTNFFTTNFVATNNIFSNETVTNSTSTNATSTNFFATTASTTNLFASTLNVGSRALVVTSGGNVGIGTSTPDGLLTLYKTGAGASSIGATFHDAVAPSYAANADNLLTVRGTGSSASTWRGRITAGGDNRSFLMGEYNSQAWLGAHVANLTAWADLYINPDGAANLYLGDAGAGVAAAPVPIASFINSTGNVGVGTTTPAFKLDVNSSASTVAAIFQGSGAGALGVGSVSSGAFLQGYTNDSAIATGALNLQASGGNTFINPSSGFLAVGTSTASADKINVWNNANGAASIRITGSGFGGPSRQSILYLTSGSDENRARGIITDSYAGGLTPWFFGSPYSADAFMVGRNSTQPEYPANALFYIASNGNTGIGTSSPSSKLQLEGSGGATLTIQRNDSAQGNGTIRFTGNDAAVDGQISYNNLVGGALSFETGGGTVANTRMVIASNGNIGVGGTTTPFQKFSIGDSVTNAGQYMDGSDLFYSYIGSDTRYRLSSNGTVALGLPTNHDGGALSLASSNNQSIISGGGQGRGNLKFFVENLVTPKAVLLNSGNFGVGTSSPLARVDIAGSNNGTIPLFQVSSVASNATTTRLYVDSAGNVGVSTTTLSDPFTVGGALRVSAAFGANTSDNYLRIFQDASGNTNFTNGGTGGSAANMLFNLGNTAAVLSGNLGGGTTFLGIDNTTASRELGFRAPTGRGIGFMVNGGSTASIANAAMYLSSAGNLGIGTSSPAAKLAVDLGSTTPGLFIGALGSTTPSLFVGSANSNGFVGVGTSNPAAVLTVNGSGVAATDGLIVTRSNVPSQYVQLSTAQGTSGVNLTGHSSSANPKPGTIANVTDGGAVGTGQAQLQFQVGNSAAAITAMVIENTSGFIGIGTSTVNSKLQVYTANAGSTIADTIRSTSNWNGTGSGSLFRFTNGHPLGSNPSGGEYNLAGIAGIDDTANWGGSLAFYTAPLGTAGGANLQERVRITNAGNFGIGTTSAFTRLSVAGNAYIGGNITATGTLSVASLSLPEIAVTYPSFTITNGTMSNQTFDLGNGSTTAGVVFEFDFKIGTTDMQFLLGTSTASGDVYFVSHEADNDFTIRKRIAGITTILANSGTPTWLNNEEGLHATLRIQNNTIFWTVTRPNGTQSSTISAAVDTAGLPMIDGYKIAFSNVARVYDFHFSSGVRRMIGGNTLTLDNENSRIGVGTTSPDSNLSVSGGNTTLHISGGGSSMLQIDGGSTAQNTGIDFSYRGAAVSAGHFGIGSNSSVSFNALGFFTGNNLSAGNNPSMVLTSAGNVGVGTTTPMAPLTVQGSSSGTGGIVISNGSQLHSMFVDSSGFFNISRTNDPNTSAILVNQGNDEFYVRTTGAGGVRLSSSGANAFLVALGSSNTLGLGANGVEAMRFVNGGNVGVGSTTPGARFAIVGSSTDATSAFMVSNSANTNLLNIQNNGSVGIGTTSPSQTFSVNGGGYFTGGVGIGTSVTANGGLDVYTSRPGNGVGQIIVGNPASAGGVTFRRFGDGAALGNVGYSSASSNGAFTISSDGGSGTLSLNTGGGGERLFIDVSGRIGVGTQGATLTGTKFTINGSNGDANTTLFAVSSSTASATTTFFTIRNTGLVGIGTTTPWAKLSLSSTDNSGMPYAAFANASSTFFRVSSTSGTVIDGGVVTPTHKGRILNGSGGASILNPASVFVLGDYAYIAAGGAAGSTGGDALEIVNIANPSSPVHRGSISHGTGGALLASSTSVFVQGRYAYVTASSSNALEIIDVSNPTTPAHVGSLTNGTGGALLGAPQSVFVAGNYAYVAASSSNALEIVDITNPSAPVHKGSLTNGTGGALLAGPRSVFVQGRYAYVASYVSNAIEVVDISNPAAPVHAGLIANPDGPLLGPTSIFVSGAYAYVTSSGSNALEIIDISNPAAPAHAGSITNGSGGAFLSNPQSVFVSENFAYVASFGSNTFEVVDVSNPAAPTHKGYIQNGSGGATLSGPQSVFVSGNNAFVAAAGTSNALEVVDVGGLVVSNTQIGSAAIDSLLVRNIAQFAQNVSIASALNVGSNAFIGGAFSVTGTSTFFGSIFASSTVSFGTTTATNLVVTNTSTSTFAGPITVGTNRLVVQQGSGNIGIGTTTPQNQLSVIGASGLSVSSLASGGNGMVGTLQLLAGTGSPVSGRLQFGTDGTGWQFRIAQNNAGVITDLFTIVTGGNVGVGSTTPFAKLSVRGAGSTTGINFQTTNSSDLPLFSILDNGNVGIGTTSPYASLSIAGATGVVANIYTATSTTATSTFAGGFDVNNGSLRYDFSSGVTNIDNLELGSMAFDTNSGIVSWTDMPVTGTAAAGTVESYTAQLDGNPMLTVYGESDGAGSIQKPRVAVGTTTPYSRFQVWGTGTSNASLFSLVNNASTTVMNVLENGNVGIGTTSPATYINTNTANILDVTGSSGKQGLLALHSNGTTQEVSLMTNVGAGAYFDVAGASIGSNNFLAFRTTSSNSSYAVGEVMRITASGNIGIGTTTPSTKLDVDGGTNLGKAKFDVSTVEGTLKLYRWSGVSGVFQGTGIAAAQTSGGTPLLKFQTAAAAGAPGTETLLDRMAIDNNGNVGIATTSPTSKLEVSANGASVSGAPLIAATGLALSTNNILGVRSASGNTGWTIMSEGGSQEFLTVAAPGGTTRVLSLYTGSGSFSSYWLPVNAATGFGFGTTTATEKVSIEGAFGGAATNTGALSLFNTSANSAGNGASVQMFSKDDNGSRREAARVGSYLVNGSPNSFSADLQFMTSGTGSLTEKMRLTSGGTLSIGSTSPATNADLVVGSTKNVSGGLNYYGILSQPNNTSAGGSSPNIYGVYAAPIATGFGGGTLGANSYGLYSAPRAIGDSTSLTYGIYVNPQSTVGTTYSGIFLGGNVGIGTTSPWAKLAVNSFNGTGPQFVVASSTGAGATTTQFIVAQSGNVGVGTTSPYQKFSVAGIVLADSFIATSTTATSTIAGFLDVNGTGANATSTFASNLWVKGTLRTGTGSLYLNDTSFSASNGGFQINTTGNSYVNAVSGNFGVGSTSPGALLAVGNGLSNGGYYFTSSGLGLGKLSPSSALDVVGAGSFTGSMTASSFSGAGTGLTGTAASLNIGGSAGSLSSMNISQFTNNSGYITDGNTNWDNLYGYITDGNTNWDNSYGFYSSGSSPSFASASISGNIDIGSGQGIYFADNGEIQSLDTHHRILFRRSEDILELREHGTIILSSGATAGAATNYATLDSSGNWSVAGSSCAGAWSNFPCLDLAELYDTTDASLSSGYIVEVDPLNDVGVRKASSGTPIGVVSTQPAILLSGTKVITGGPSATSTPGKVAVALSGHIPVRVNDENGLIASGDKVALSSVPGVGRKAFPGETTIGVAMQNATTSEDVIQVFANLSHGVNSSGFNINSSGNIGIGTTTPQYKLQVIGDVAAQSFVNISTRTSKRDIEYLNDTDKASILEKIKSVGVATYHYNTEDDSQALHLGLIAEEAPAEVLANGGKGVDVYKMSTFILAGVQEMAKRLDDVETRLATNETDIESLKGTVAELESKIALLANGGSIASTTIAASTTITWSSDIGVQLMSFLESAGLKLQNGIAYITNVVVETLSANIAYIKDATIESASVGALTVGTAEKRSGITLYDQYTGDPYCLKIAAGQTITSPGECPVAATSTPAINQPAPGVSGSYVDPNATSGSNGGSTEPVATTPSSTIDANGNSTSTEPMMANPEGSGQGTTTPDIVPTGTSTPDIVTVDSGSTDTASSTNP